MGGPQCGAGHISGDDVTTVGSASVDVGTLHARILPSSWQNRSPVSFPSRVPSLPASVSVGDPSATRTVYVTVILLVVLGFALAALAVWLWRRTRPEPQLLAPLEEMATRGWRKQDPAGQRRALDASRPAGARPVRREAAVPVVDSEFAAERPVVGFDDLAEVRASASPEDDVEPDDELESTDGVESDATADLEVDGGAIEIGDSVVRDASDDEVTDEPIERDDADLDDADLDDAAESVEPDSAVDPEANVADTDTDTDTDDGDATVPTERLLRRPRLS